MRSGKQDSIKARTIRSMSDNNNKTQHADEAAEEDLASDAFPGPLDSDLSRFHFVGSLVAPTHTAP